MQATQIITPPTPTGQTPPTNEQNLIALENRLLAAGLGLLAFRLIVARTPDPETLNESYNRLIESNGLADWLPLVEVVGALEGVG